MSDNLDLVLEAPGGRVLIDTDVWSDDTDRILAFITRDQPSVMVVWTPEGLRTFTHSGVRDERVSAISVLERLITKSGAAWTLHRGQWEESDA